MTANLKRIINVLKDDDLIITPHIHKWLMQHPEGLVLTQEDLEVLVPLVMASPRNRSNSFSCSARLQCVRRQQFTYLGVPAQTMLNPELQNKFNDGTWRHLRWQMMMLKAGVVDAVEVPFHNEMYNLRGSLDAKGGSEKWGVYGVELKGVGSLGFVKEGPYINHIYQVHSYFAVDPTLDYVSLIYEDKMTQLWREWVIERDPVIMSRVRRELRKLNQATEKKRLLPILEGCKGAKGPDYRNCPYSGFCLTATWEKAEREGRSLRNSGDPSGSGST